MESAFDLAIIGGGPGGYVCAIRASQLGLKAAIIEMRPTMGGTCVNVGCIPSKALLDSSEKFSKAVHDFKDHGIQTGTVKIDVAQMMARKDRVVKELTDGLNYLMTKNKITVFRGKGSFVKTDANGTTLACTAQDGSKTELTARNVVIASGSEIIRIPGFEPDGETVITSDHAIALKEVPKHLIVIGGGVIGLELGSVWMRLGAKVTVVELLPDILMGMDKQMRELARRTLQKQGMEFLLEHKVVSAEKKKGGVTVQLETTAGEKKSLEGDRLLVAVGRRPYTDGLNTDAVGVKINARGRVEVNPHTLATSAPGIYAIGDVIEGAMLAHKAEEEGVMVAEIIAGKKGHVNYKALPYIVYTWPEFAWVGQSEEELQKAGIEYRTGKFLFRPNGRAKAMNEPDGQVKFIADKRTDTILGVFIVGPNASELIAEAVVAMEFGASAEDIARSFHAHPTLSEAVKEAALDVDKRSIHS